jgi:hypothetical protein
MTEDEKLEAIVAIMNRSNYVIDWPKDERKLYRKLRAEHSFTEANNQVQRLRAKKILTIANLPGEREHLTIDER